MDLSLSVGRTDGFFKNVTLLKIIDAKFPKTIQNEIIGACICNRNKIIMHFIAPVVFQNMSVRQNNKFKTSPIMILAFAATSYTTRTKHKNGYAVQFTKYCSTRVVFMHKYLLIDCLVFSVGRTIFIEPVS